jgi:predicted site-specific integrase-resolvase
VWITRRRAAEILGCSTNTVDRLIEHGALTPRTDVPRLDGSLDQEEVASLAARRYEEREAVTRARQERERRKSAPPDDEHQWLTASQASRVLGMSPMGVYKRVHRGTIPYTDHRGRHWFRQDHMELMRNARAGTPR